MSRRPRSPEVSKDETNRARERILKRKLAAEQSEKKEVETTAPAASKWDQAPAGFEGMTVGEVAAHAPKLLALPITNSVVNPNQLRQARRLYVGNIPHKALNEESIVKFFNTAMISAGKTGLGNNPPIIGAQINFDKGYAFLEFEHSKVATDCMLFDGIILEGNTLKMRRPKDYVALPESYREEGDLNTRPKQKGIANIADLVPAGLCSTTVPDTPNKLFCGAIPIHLTEEQVKELFCSFGALRGFNMVRDKAKGCYAFFEYMDPSVTDQAVNGLHGMKIGEKTLIVQRSSTGGQQQQAQMALGDSSLAPAHAAAAACLTLNVPLLNILTSLGVDRDREAGPTLVLVNLFRPKDLLSDEEYEDALADVRGEMEQHGRVVDLHIVRPAPEDDPSLAQLEGRRQDWAPGNAGFAFCTFATAAEAAATQKVLQGRKFNGRSVVSYLAPK